VGEAMLVLLVASALAFGLGEAMTLILAFMVVAAAQGGGCFGGAGSSGDVSDSA